MELNTNTLRSRRNTDFGAITKEFEKSGNANYADDRYWKPEKDKAGNASATIRFLPRTEGDDLPWVKIFSHGFKGDTGRWFIEDCLTTLMDETGSPRACPMCAYNSTLWNSVNDDKHPLREQVRKQKRKLNYVSNILVVNDPKHPENNGKVFLFKFGKKIFDKIMDKARPAFEDETPVNVFDYWEGANFKLRMKMADGYPNYDSSEFEPVSQVAKTDEEILEIAKSQYKLKELVDSSKFKSYAELERKLQIVLNGTPASTQKAEDMVKTPTREAVQPKSTTPPMGDSDSDSDDEMMDYFQKLADDDDAPF